MQANVQGNHLNSSTCRLATDRHTHQKEMDLVGLYSALQPMRIVQLGVRIWPGTWPPCAVSSTPTQRSGTRTHDPESNEPPILAATNDETSTTVLTATTNTTTRNPGKRPQTKEQRVTTAEQRAKRRPDPRHEHLSYPSPSPREWRDPL